VPGALRPRRRTSPDAAAVSASPDPEPTDDAGSADPAAGCVHNVTSADVDEALSSKKPATDDLVWIVRGRSGDTFLTLTVRESSGAKGGASNGSFGAEQRTPAKASVALTVQTDCHAHGDHYHCGPTFVPESGSWSFARLDTSAGGQVDVDLSAELAQVAIKGGLARPVAGSPRMCLGSLGLHA